MTFFNPVETPFKYDVPLTFENLKIHNKLVYPGKNAIIDKDLSYQPDVYLKHSQTSFSISLPHWIIVNTNEYTITTNWKALTATG